MENKQTAVDWLVKELTNLGYIYAPSFGHAIIDNKIEQAKEMEKEQIVEAFHEGMQTNFDPNYGIALKYYESNYGK